LPSSPRWSCLPYDSLRRQSHHAKLPVTYSAIRAAEPSQPRRAPPIATPGSRRLRPHPHRSAISAGPASQSGAHRSATLEAAAPDATPAPAARATRYAAVLPRLLPQPHRLAARLHIVMAA
jgi:hypothetical protein